MTAASVQRLATDDLDLAPLGVNEPRAFVEDHAHVLSALHLARLKNLSLSPVGRSLTAAFALGVPWTPQFHSHFQGQVGSAELADDNQITGEELYLILSRTLFEREGVAHDGGTIGNRSYRQVVEDHNDNITFDRRGIYANGLKITGRCNWRALKQEIPIFLYNCEFVGDSREPQAFDGEIILTDARLGPLRLNGSKFRDFIGDGIEIKGDLGFRLCRARHVDLRGAHIDGILNFSDATLNDDGKDLGDRSGIVLDCDSASIGASVFLATRDAGTPFSARGQINFVGATIGGQLACVGTFENQNGSALVFEAASIRSSLFLQTRDRNAPSRVNGQVNFSAAYIGGHVYLGEFDGEKPFSIEGEVNFDNATVEGSFSCVGGGYSAEEGPAVSCRSANIVGFVYFTGGLRALGGVDFTHATIGGSFACETGEFISPKGCAVNCGGIWVGADVFFRGGVKVLGEARFVRSITVGRFEVDDAEFDCGESEFAFNLQEAKIGSALWLDKIKRARGVFNLNSSHVEELREDTSAWRDTARLGHPARANVKLQLDGFTYDRFAAKTDVRVRTRMAWLEMQAKFSPQPWRQCAKVLAEMGHTRAALLIAEKREWMRLRHTPLLGEAGENPLVRASLFLPRIAYHILRRGFGWLTGFGYAYFRTTLIALLTIGIGAFVYKGAYDHNLLIHDPGTQQTAATLSSAERDAALSHHPNAGKSLPSVYPSFNCLMYSLDTFAPIINLRQKEYWVPGSNDVAQINAGVRALDLHGLLEALWPLLLDPDKLKENASKLAEDLPNIDWRFTESAPSVELIWIWTWIEIAMGWLLTTAMVARFTGLLDSEE